MFSIRSKRLWATTILLIFFIIVILMRVPLLRSMGAWFVATDAPASCDAMFVLGGGAKARGLHAAELWNEGHAPLVYCMGRPNYEEWAMMGFFPKEPNLTRQYVIQGGVPEAKVQNITQGTSSHEERELILSVCRREGYSCVIVVTSEMHTRRVRRHFEDRFRRAGIQLILTGAQDTGYHPGNWWQREDGLIFVNNEIIKLLYYFLKH
jgi:uncharacterized SAM-binding protein YcdF (DUF218 family)